MKRKLTPKMLSGGGAPSLALLTLSIVLALPAASQSNVDAFKESLARADANGDGDVTRAEITESRANIFNRLDRKADGVINKRDRPPRVVRQRYDEIVARLAEGFDANQDGEITYDEFVGGPTPGFDRGDTNGDDTLSAEEIANLSPRTEN